ncbi:hypothetical protein NERG_00910 [Nematocida ausubeli]|uniref:BRCT domain-containing protein n=1 Tax=Nematocida ausubeli (strain ATCC PRA-371 / ERTm2) TaxID=1913371 RepID=H8ZBG1_NEMA1|nr:hypothetical protein NERG_00910 [Nematocida ausubeli]
MYIYAYNMCITVVYYAYIWNITRIKSVYNRSPCRFITKYPQKPMEEKENIDKIIRLFNNNPDIHYTPHFIRRLLPSREEEKIKSRPILKLALSDLPQEQIDFIKGTIARISEILEYNIFVDSNNIKDSTHLIVGTDSTGLCKRTYNYLASIILKKSIVGFTWYIELFDRSKKKNDDEYYGQTFKQYIESITKNNLVKGDVIEGPSSAPRMAHMSCRLVPALDGVIVADPDGHVSKIEERLISMGNGHLTAEKEKGKIIVKKFGEITEMIASGAILTYQKMEDELSDDSFIYAQDT